MRIRVFDGILWGVTFLLVVTVFLMPDTVPLHWDENWQIDGYGSRYMFLILAFIPMAIYYGMSLTKHIDPKRMNLEKRKKTYRLFQYGLTVFFLILAAFFEYSAFNPQQDGEQFVLLLVSVLLIGMGNYLPKIPQNYFFGVKTPWTLANEYVWKKTHKVCGYAFVIIGIIIALCGILHFPYSYIVLLIGLVVITIGIYVYSYFLYKEYSKNIDG
ncbi:SdpI family protein [Massilimicrobiota timonensis]|uniref:SdpI family protein n=1 Tax=Massilimicrobiota timonensis TaxID=1776392 RepID=UPI00195FA595|nr:SdpI family protein [Massilimicrobiota timonensis]MBM6966254.1 SdpI family protein [Massilimicrobiota timonensis]